MDEEIPYNELLLDVEDGIVVGLYHYLWLRDGKGRACPEVNIPHTIIICNGRPKVWYFTSGKERCVKRKNRANITNATITEALAPVTNSSSSSPKPNNGNAVRGGGGAMGASGDIATSLLGTWGVSPFPGPAPQQQQPQPGQGYRGRNSNQQQQQQQLDSTGGGPGSGGRVADGTSTGTALGPWPHHGVVARFQGSMTMPHNAGGTANRGASLGRRRKGTQFELQDEAVEFFTREQLAEMLPPGTAVVHGVAALHEGVLQRFVQPRGQHHFSIRATWSPNACVVERRTSKAKLNDPRVSLADRLAGWDGPNWLSDHTLITGTVLHGSICRLCDNVAAHLADVSGGGVRVLRMVLFFCVDEANRIWLTHCGSLKTQRLREYIAATGPHLMQHVPSRMRAGSGAVPPLLPSPSAALRLRSPDGAGALSADPSLDLPAPSAAFLASKAAMAAEASSGSAGGGGGGRFLCVLTGEMYPAAQRCDVTYKQLLQHWFSLASQLPNEGDRLRAMDTIPLAIRRANPSLTREWYLRVRSQPTFLYRTAPVCLEAAAQITGLGPDELQRTVVLPSASGSGAAAAGAAAGPGPGPGSGPQQVSTGLLAGWGGAGALVTHGSPPGTARAGDGGGALSRQTTNNTTGAVRAQLTVGPTGRQRPATALPPAGPSSGGGGGHSLMLQQPQPVSFRSGSRMQQPQQAQLHPSATATARRFATRSKSASPSVATSRLPPTSSSGGGAGGGIGGGGLPSMLLPRDSGLAAGGSGVGGGLGRVPSFLQVYGPTPEQAAEAAAAAAALPYEVLDEAQQLGDAGGDDPDGSDGADEPGPRGRAQPEPDGQAGRAVSPRSDGHCRVDTEEDGGDGRNGDDGAAEVDGLGPSAAQPSSPPSAAHPAGTAGGGGHGRPGSPRHGAGGSGQASGYASASTAVPRTSSHSSRQFPPVGAGAGSRISTSSELTEMGSVASFSDPTSPNSAPAYYSQAHGAAAAGPSSVAAVGPPASAPSAAAASRLSPPRSAGLLTLHTIHEEGGSAAALPPPPSASSGRSGSPLAAAGAELLFSPPSRGGAGPHSHSHSVPRMRPPSRAGGLERQALQAPSRRLVGGGPVGGQMYSVVHHHHHHHGSGGSGGGARCGSFSESGDLAPSLPGAAAGAGAGMGGVGSLNSTLASSVGNQSRRSVSNQAGGLSSEDMRTLRELSEAYTAAERLTQQLLAQAHEILSEDGGSRPGSTGTSPMHGGRGRQPLVSPRGTGTIPNSRPGTGNSISAYAAFSGAGGGLGGVRRPSSSNGSGGASNGSGGGGGSGRPGQRPGSSALTPAPAPATGPSPLGQQEPTLAPTAGSDRSSNAATANAGGAAGGGDGVVEGAAAGPGPDRALLPTQSPAGAPSNQPPVLVGTGSAASGALQEAAVGTGASRGMGTGTGSAAEAGGASGTGPAVGSHPAPHPHVPPDLGLFTSAEADLLAEALQD